MSSNNKSAMGLLCELINRDNPGLKIPITEAIIGVRKAPTSIAVGTYGRNSRITVTGKPGMGYTGDATVMYDRLSLNSLFNGISASAKVPGGKWKQKDLIPYFVDQLGLALQEADFTQAWLDTEVNITGAGKAVVIAAASVSYCYTGGVSVNVVAGPKAYYPDSGPGTKGLVFGDEDAGFFGIVSSAELMTGSELSRLIWNNVNNPSILTDDVSWGKFFWRGAVVYFALAVVANTRWQTLYLKGAALGDMTFGTVPDSWVQTLQNLLVTKRFANTPYTFRVRLPRAAQANLIRNMTVAEDSSEIMRLIRHCIPVSWNGTGEWYDALRTGIIGSFMSANTDVAGGSTYIVNYTGKQITTFPQASDTGWFPVLEYIDPNKEVVPLGEVTGGVSSLSPVLPIDSYSSYIEGLTWSLDSGVVPGVIPITPTGILETVIKPLMWSDASPQVYYRNTVLPVDIKVDVIESLKWSPRMPQVLSAQPITVTSFGIYDPSTKIDLSKLNGTLDGF